MKRYFSLAIFCILTFLTVLAQPTAWGEWPKWGDQGDGTFRNPILPADFSDIDCIEHDGYYYAISSTFQFSPGMVILRSKDMVNWCIISHAVPDIRQISPALNWDQMDRYARGIWAGSIRWYAGRFYVYFGTPDEGMFMTTAKHAEGPWEPLHKMNFFENGWDDCCPLFDDDGQKYFVASHFADNYKTYIYRLTDDGRDIIPSSATLIHESMWREANKLYKWGDTYYHLFSEFDGNGRYLMMKRSAHPMGPYDEVHQLSNTQREWMEPNQGGYLQDGEGHWFYFTHHGTGDWAGRIASVLPVTWIDGWPIIGAPDSQNVGNMVWQLPKPATPTGKHVARKKDATEEYLCLRRMDDPSWEWNFHPREGWYEVKKNSVTLRAFRPLESNNLRKAGNTYAQRVWRSEACEATVRIDLRQMADGQRSGMGHFSESWMEFGVRQEGHERQLYFLNSNLGDSGAKVIATGSFPYVYLRHEWGLDGLCSMSYSLDGQEFMPITWYYQLAWGSYRGDRLALYTYNNKADEGAATFDQFCYRVKRK